LAALAANQRWLEWDLVSAPPAQTPDGAAYGNRS
jgi:hypothetical protein